MITNVYNIRDSKTNEVVGYKMVLNNVKEYGVPLAEDNTDYQAIQEWAAIEGNNIIDPGA
tara:strand:- start:183 stop:362 length:180 start_codon:yes stop_codon:yes gene_type:complete